MSRLLGVRASLRFSVHHDPANLAPDSHASRIGVVMLRVQFLAQGLGFLEDLGVVGIPDPGVEFWGVGGSGVRVIGR